MASSPSNPSSPVSNSPNVVTRLARRNILDLLPYRCARDDYDEGILLDANENAFGAPLQKKPAHENKNGCPVTNDINSHQLKLELERYPCPYQIPLKTLYTSYRQARVGNDVNLHLAAKNVFVGVGSDEAIDMLMRIFCTPGNGEDGDHIMITPPTYGMYTVCAKVNDVGVVKVPLTKEFDVPVDEILSTVNSKTKLLFLCSPGNPTAKAIPLATIETILQSEKYQGIVVVDEAYIDFCAPNQSALTLCHKYPERLVVLQTLSKAFGLAGIRMGFALSGNSQIIQLMNNVKAPYNVNKLTSDLACSVLADPKNMDRLHANIDEALKQRATVMDILSKLSFVEKVFESDSNFILFRVKLNGKGENVAKIMYQAMADHGGVVTRFRGTEVHCDECIRVTVGTGEENKVFIRELKKAWEDAN
eukprot:CAMPEP_0195518166 /NCGR_PEP_ID=MMETSP0794_2-20130614/12439_1 /TAXON_ID=515487 /ORGANISM="Stephanopyxis turris, Strain CCMP 815" /LENGTH=418 /DNA_ID=CAMNT_0040647089 /DNA_START=111 /DNA_END=1367 /DNA_ORIENTATION=-